MVDANTISGEKPAELSQALHVMLNDFRKVGPELKGQIRPKDSVRKGLQVIQRLNAETSGSFLSHNGDRWWLWALLRLLSCVLPWLFNLPSIPISYT